MSGRHSKIVGFTLALNWALARSVGGGASRGMYPVISAVSEGRSWSRSWLRLAAGAIRVRSSGECVRSRPGMNDRASYSTIAFAGWLAGWMAGWFAGSEMTKTIGRDDRTAVARMSPNHMSVVALGRCQWVWQARTHYGLVCRMSGRQAFPDIDEGLF